MPESRVIASRVVSWELQEQFASFCGDRNPMHMDQIAARRTQAGQPVVHGVHTLLWALESLIASGSVVSPFLRIKAKFLKWVYPGDEAVLSLPLGELADPRMLQVDILGMAAIIAEISYEGPIPMDVQFTLTPSPVTPLASAAARSFADLESCSGNAYTALAPDSSVLFPHLSAHVSGTAVAEIAACSYLVGMEVPGLHSMFSKLDLAVLPKKEPLSIRTGLDYRVSYWDHRFRKARIVVNGQSIAGTLEAFVRLPPVEQASMETASTRVTSSEFSGMAALIIGGSRGLGELTAKLIAAGGGKPIISYAVGRIEAEAVNSQIRDWGGRAEVIQYDVSRSPEQQLQALSTRVTHLFYFATNTIFRPKGDLLSPLILMDFVKFYLHGFYDLCKELVRKEKPYSIRGAKLAVFYPSSVAVEERPAGMTEYAMTKAAGEQLCRDMNQYLPDLRTLVSRLPRLRTDQTASVIPERELDPIDVILPIIRQMKALGSES